MKLFSIAFKSYSKHTNDKDICDAIEECGLLSNTLQLLQLI